MRPVVVSIINTFLEVVEPNQLNCFLVDGHLNIYILVLWFKYFYVVVIIQYLLDPHPMKGPVKTFLSVCLFVISVFFSLVFYDF